MAIYKKHNIDYFKSFSQYCISNFVRLDYSTGHTVHFLTPDKWDWIYLCLNATVGKIFIYTYVSFYWNILIVYCHGFYRDTFTGVYHILLLLTLFSLHSWCFHHCPR